MIRVVDYGLGNVQAFLTAFKRIGVSADRARSGEELHGATHLILPGVGAFDHAMQLLNGSGMRPILETLVMEHSIPVLGVCVGMQLLASGSDEGSLEGLNWIPGRVRHLGASPSVISLPLPHMGWNDLSVRRDARLFGHGLADRPRFYFLHSYYFDAAEDDIDATAHYGVDIPAVVSRGHIFGVQCHPEKSHKWGFQLLKNFASL